MPLRFSLPPMIDPRASMGYVGNTDVRVGRIGDVFHQTAPHQAGIPSHPQAHSHPGGALPNGVLMSFHGDVISRKKTTKAKRLERKGKKKSAKKRKQDSRKFYKSWEWKQLRYQVLNYYGRTCMCCGASSLDGKVMVVDHVRPVSKYPKLALDFHNCQVLCNDCNMGKSNTDETDFRPEQLEPEAESHIREIVHGNA